MAKLLPSLYRAAKRRIKAGLRDRRTLKLYDAAERLLVDHDHENISVAQLARQAGISVGAFYQRFDNKDTFLSLVVFERMHSERDRMERDLDPKRWQHRTAGAVTGAIVEAMMRGLHGRGAGVVRAALKRGHLDRQKLAPLVGYRTALGDRAVALLEHRVKRVRHPERAVRAAVQIAVATALDALLHDAATLRPGSRRMADVLSTMMLRLLDLPADARPANGQDECHEPAQPEDADEDALIEMPIEDIVAIEIPAQTSVKTRQRRHPTAIVFKPIPVISPTLQRATPEEAAEAPTLTQRHRPRF